MPQMKRARPVPRLGGGASRPGRSQASATPRAAESLIDPGSAFAAQAVLGNAAVADLIASQEGVRLDVSVGGAARDPKADARNLVLETEPVAGPEAAVAGPAMEQQAAEPAVATRPGRPQRPQAPAAPDRRAVQHRPPVETRLAEPALSPRPAGPTRPQAPATPERRPVQRRPGIEQQASAPDARAPVARPQQAPASRSASGRVNLDPERGASGSLDLASGASRLGVQADREGVRAAGATQVRIGGQTLDLQGAASIPFGSRQDPRAPAEDRARPAGVPEQAPAQEPARPSGPRIEDLAAIGLGALGGLGRKRRR